MTAETPAFLESLRAFVDEITPKAEKKPEGASDAAVDEDKTFVREKLLAVKEACEIFDKKIIKSLIAELKEKTLLQRTEELLNAITDHLMDSDFDEVVNAINKYAEI